MSQDRQNRLRGTVDSSQDATFTSSSLPRTLELALVVKAIILPLLNGTPRTWPYADRVISWLLPTLGEDIQNYHGRNGPPLSKMFPARAVEHLDADLLVRLAAVVEKLRPGLLAQLQELSAAHNDENGAQ